MDDMPKRGQEILRVVGSKLPIKFIMIIAIGPGKGAEVE
jgi:hypothetical protein